MREVSFCEETHFSFLYPSHIRPISLISPISPISLISLIRPIKKAVSQQPFSFKPLS